MFGLRRTTAATEKATPTIDLEVRAAETTPGHYQVRGQGYEGLKAAVHARVVDEAGALLSGDGPETALQLRRLVAEAAMLRDELITPQRQDALASELLDEIRGLGPLEPLLRDPTISEIMVNSPHQIYVEQAGKILLTGVRFEDDRHLLRIIDRIVSRVGRHVDEASPMVDARLPDGSRVNAVIPPLALNGACLTIRRFSRDPLKVEDLVGHGSMTPGIAEFLRLCVVGKLNVLVSGGTGSGKTTVLNVLSGFIPGGERLITIEDAAELQLQQPHVVKLETRQANSEGSGAIGQADLLRNCLRMRPDRIIIGEVRGGEALTMLQAMNTGHEGSMTTVHSNSCRDALSRLETMVLMAGMDLPHRAIREQIASALDLVVQIERSPDGKRRVVAIAELVGMEGDVYLLQDIFRFVVTGRGPEGEILGQHKPTGIVPRCQARLEARGLHVPLWCFTPGGEP
jgi:pilus assembly protein CpaF